MPRIIVQTASTQSTGVHSARSGSRADRKTRANTANAGGLDGGRHEARHDGGRRLVGVGRPHVERHGGHLEGQARPAGAPCATRSSGLPVNACACDRCRHVVEVRAAGEAVRERDAVQEERAREPAEDEVLEGAFRARALVAAQARQHVERQREDLERQEDHEEVGRHGDEHHAGQGEQQERVVLAGGQAVAVDGLRREHEGEQAHAHQDQTARTGRSRRPGRRRSSRPGVPRAAGWRWRRRRGR